ncbi:hypothetical protein GPECTOR_20g570 [Gonium pectorale]|uniref:BTB domain-containing protein n=1 Tax=Gonium pectorale TaxID=33097 RepID=A0A150GIS7_GONPE|nr:hypothetical protein GPECTOR_20g570 [Gonium pectorale]|eukprot:KXZ49713.1 hypothetical protein GPECTOR_20g570 [Gonium pectorale]
MADTLLVVSNRACGHHDPTTDVTVAVAEAASRSKGSVRRFRAHRAVLAGACGYFRQLFYGGKPLPEAAAATVKPSPPSCATATAPSPSAAAAATRCLPRRRTSACHAAAPAARLAELAERLQAPAAAAGAQRLLLAGCWPEEAVELMLRPFRGLVEGLWAFTLRHAAAVVEAAPDSVARLAAGSPELMAQLYVATVQQAKAA